MRKINYKSDFDFLLRLTSPDGAEMGFPTYNWRLNIYTKLDKNTVFTASYENGVPTNCFNDDGAIHVVCDNHGFGKGSLYAEFYADIPNAIYADGVQLTVTPFALGIQLVDAASDGGGEIDVENTLSVVFLNAYDLAVSQGYVGTAKEYMKALVDAPNAVKIAKEAKEACVESGVLQRGMISIDSKPGLIYDGIKPLSSGNHTDSLSVKVGSAKNFKHTAPNEYRLSLETAFPKGKFNGSNEWELTPDVYMSGISSNVVGGVLRCSIENGEFIVTTEANVDESWTAFIVIRRTKAVPYENRYLTVDSSGRVRFAYNQSPIQHKLSNDFTFVGFCVGNMCNITTFTSMESAMLLPDRDVVRGEALEYPLSPLEVQFYVNFRNPRKGKKNEKDGCHSIRKTKMA